MATGERAENDVTFFSEELCSRADDALRMAFLLTLDRKAAHQIVKVVYDLMAKAIGSIEKDASVTGLLVKHCWDGFVKSKKTPPGTDMIAGALAKLPVEVRASIGAVDFMGLSVDEAGEALGMETTEIRAFLASGREALLKGPLAARH